MKENKEPVLFVNTVSVYKEEEKVKKKTRVHRLDDIEVLLKLNQEIEIEVEFSNNTLRGIVKELTSKNLIIIIENKDITINIENIKRIDIISTK